MLLLQVANPGMVLVAWLNVEMAFTCWFLQAAYRSFNGSIHKFGLNRKLVIK